MPLILCVLSLLLVCADPAGAASVGFVSRDCDSRYCIGESELRFDAAAGEANDVRIRHERGVVTVEEAGAELRVGSGCEAVGTSGARCRANLLLVFAGDGDDRVVIESPGSTAVDGGAGDDVLAGAGGADDLDGGAGRDVLEGGAGDDRLHDGSEVGEDDVFDGGAGLDTVTFDTIRRPLRIDLARGTATSALEADRLVSIENAQGGAGDDVIAGDQQDNKLSGGDGRNQLYGRDGADVLELGPLGEHADAGSGDDVISASQRGTVTCGPGRDAVQVQSHALLRPDCERVGEGATVVDLHLPLASARAPIATASPTTKPLRIRLSGAGPGGQPVASFSRRPRLNALGRRLLRRRGRLVVLVTEGLLRFRVVLELPDAA